MSSRWPAMWQHAVTKLRRTVESTNRRATTRQISSLALLPNYPTAQPQQSSAQLLRSIGVWLAGVSTSGTIATLANLELHARWMDIDHPFVHRAFHLFRRAAKTHEVNWFRSTSHAE